MSNEGNPSDNKSRYVALHLRELCVKIAENERYAGKIGDGDVLRRAAQIVDLVDASSICSQ